MYRCHHLTRGVSEEVFLLMILLKCCWSYRFVVLQSCRPPKLPSSKVKFCWSYQFVVLQKCRPRRCRPRRCSPRRCRPPKFCLSFCLKLCFKLCSVLKNQRRGSQACNFNRRHHATPIYFRGWTAFGLGVVTLVQSTKWLAPSSQISIA